MVLILIILEVPLWGVYKHTSKSGIACLNPYYTGSTTLGREIQIASSQFLRSLNPYYTGSTTLGAFFISVMKIK